MIQIAARYHTTQVELKGKKSSASENKVCNVVLCACFGSEGVDQAVEKYGLQKITLLREISIKAGIQVMILSMGPFQQMFYAWQIDTPVCNEALLYAVGLCRS